MTSGISTFLESLAPPSAGAGLLLSGSRPACGNCTPPADSEMGATAAEGRSASNATSAKRSSAPPPPSPWCPCPCPPADHSHVYCRWLRGASSHLLNNVSRCCRENSVSVWRCAGRTALVCQSLTPETRR